MKDKILYIVISIVIIICLIFSYRYDLNVDTFEEDLISYQKEIDKQIEKYSKDNYTIENPKIIVNPYRVSPLTALIIFNTDNPVRVHVYVNDELISNMNLSLNHIIPIYYLKENFENKIKLVVDDKEYIHTIKTNKLDFNKIKIYKKADVNKKIMLSSSTSGLLYSLFNTNGELIWHLDINSQGFIYKLKNGNFLVSTEEVVSEDNISYITGLYEMNVLGKIIKRYDLKNMFHHSLKVLDDNTVIICGNNKGKPMGYVYRISLDDGSVLDSVDFDSVLSKYIEGFHRIDMPYGLGINSVDYLDGHLLVSMRNLNLIVSINYKTKEVDYFIANKGEYKFKTLTKVKYVDSIYGIHDASYQLDINKVSFYNNNYNMKKDDLKIKEIPASGVLVDGTAKGLFGKTKTVVTTYINENKNSYAFGSFSLSGKKALVNYSYQFKDYAHKSNLSVLDFQNHTYSDIIYYDKSKKVIFKGYIEDRIYKADFFEFDSYNDDYEIEEYKYINTLNPKEEVKYIETKEKYANIFDIHNNYFSTELSDEFDSDIYLILCGKKCYKIKYLKDKTYFDIPEDTYSVYLEFDNIRFKLNKKIKKET